jgi:probable lipoprotein (TIGR04455 family)
VKQAPDWNDRVKKIKRIVVVSSPENKITKMEDLLLTDLLREQLSHHKEFIVYKEPPKFNKSCSKEFPKIEGIFFVKVNQIEKDNKLLLSMETSIVSCADGKKLWTTLGEDKFSLDNKENESLRKTYVQRYGLVIESRVNPYYYLFKEILEKLDSPVLTEEEQEEKIDIESV